MRKLLFVFILMFSIVIGKENSVKKADDFTLKDINNQNFRLSETVKKYDLTIVNFWATWCTPCRAEIKDLTKLYKDIKNLNVHIVSISIDDTKTTGRVKSFAHANRMNYDVLLDSNNEVMRLYNVTNPPFTLILDKDMNIIYKHSGYRKGDVQLLKKEIENHLALKK